MDFIKFLRSQSNLEFIEARFHLLFCDGVAAFVVFLKDLGHVEVGFLLQVVHLVLDVVLEVLFLYLVEIGLRLRSQAFAK